MDKDPSDTFSGKVLLLLIDKIAIGGIIALAFLGYSIWQTRDQRSYDEKITLSFKRVEYIKELAPMVVDQKNDPISRAQALFALERDCLKLTPRRGDSGSAENLIEDAGWAGGQHRCQVQCPTICANVLWLPGARA